MTSFLMIAAIVAACSAPAASDARHDSANGELQAWSQAAPVPRDSLAAASRALREAGRPWAAYRVVEPALRDSARRTPAIVLAAAEAAAAWGGWSHVSGLLRDVRLADATESAQAGMLRARAAFARGADSAALAHAAAALGADPSPVRRGERLLLHARALDRLDRLDSARARYLDAARAMPEVGDWLRLRAAGVTRDAGARRALYRQVTEPAARAHIARNEARALERTEDFAAAAKAFADLGDRDDALRASATDAMRRNAPRDSIRRALVEAVRRHAGRSDARAAVELLDQWFAPLTAAEELHVARATARSGPLGRARAGFERAAKGAALDGDDRFQYARVLHRLNRDREAAREYARVTGAAALRAAAAYQRARALLGAGDLAGSRAALRGILANFPVDSSAGLALFLLADLATDEGRDDAARAAFREGAGRFPRSWRASRARFLAALIAYTQGDHRTAAREWDALVADAPNGEEVNAARYWSGRAWAALGDRDAARQRWRTLIDDEPTSYYAFRSAQRLGLRDWTPFDSIPDPATPASRHPSLERAMRLEALDLDYEARLEYDHLERLARDRADSLGAIDASRQLIAADRAWRAIPLAAGAVSRRAPKAAEYRALYPAPRLEVIAAESRKHGIDPALFAALVRQESWYNPRARSGADARGYAQVLPRVGRAVARSLRFPHWDDAMLYEPEASIQLGTAHLAASLRSYDSEAKALAAYNAGQSRVQRWRKKQGTDDVEVFIERIPYTETRDYVRIVLRNRELYRALYPALRGE